MALKKSNLSPDVKSRLRQAVLGAITQQQPKNKPPALAAKTVIAPVNTNKIPLKTLNKISSGYKPATPIMPTKIEKKPIAYKSASVEKPVVAAPPTPVVTTIKPQVVTKPITEIKPKVKVKAKAKSKTKAVKAKKTSTHVKKTKVISATAKAKEMPASKVVPVKASVAAVKTKSVFPSSIYNKSAVSYKRDWEKPVANKNSLESLFNAPKSSLAKSGGFFKQATTKPTPNIVAQTIKPIIPFRKKDQATVSEHKKGGLGYFFKFVGFILLILILLLAFDILGIYRLGFKDQISYQVTKNLQLPAGSVNGQMISLTDYLSDLQLLNLPLTQKREGLIDYSTSPDVKDKIFYRLAALDIMNKKLASYGKAVSTQDLDKQVDLLLQQTGGQVQAEKVVKNIYGLNLEQFRNKVLRPMLLREDLQQAIMADATLAINKTAKDRADEVLKLARVSSTDFSALAKQYTDDEASVNTGGELGWVVKGQLDPQWESLIFKASSSTVLPQVVKSNFGYHVIKVEQKLIDPVSNVESVKLRHILIKVDIDKYIKELLDGAKLVKYVE